MQQRKTPQYGLYKDRGAKMKTGRISTGLLLSAVFFGSMVIAAVWDTIDDYELDGEGLIRTGIQGAIAGAMA